MDLLSVPECVIKKGRHRGHRFGKQPGDKEYFTANQMQQERFQGIHDRPHSMIENHRDEDLRRRRCDALEDEDHTHHLTGQEYFHYKSKWWLHSNKQGSNTVPLRHRSDFKQALSTMHRLQQEAGEEPHVSTYSNKHKTMGGTKFIFYMVELARFMVDSFTFRKSRRRCTKY